MNGETKYDLVCVCHLRWDFVWQRPQHLMQRLSKGRKLLFVEEPLAVGHGAGEREVVVNQVADSIWTARMHVPIPREYWVSFVSEWQEEYEREIARRVREWTDRPVALWLYHPHAQGFIRAIQPDIVVTDIMDQLSQFLGAPPELIERERELLRQSDRVFTGGVSMYRDKLPHNPDTHLFPSGVEQAHFVKAQRPDTPVPADLDAVPAPRIGYYGVIDERLDYDLLRAAAQARPDWHWVMIGPVVKVDPSILPQAPNLHYLGQKGYGELPGYLKGFDAAMMPFALNAATEFISPTKTLEYMAGGKPIISTPVRDVVELYGEVVRAASTPEEFVSVCEAALTEDEASRRRRREVEERILRQYEWDDIATRMNELLESARREKVAA